MKIHQSSKLGQCVTILFIAHQHHGFVNMIYKVLSVHIKAGKQGVYGESPLAKPDNVLRKDSLLSDNC